MTQPRTLVVDVLETLEAQLAAARVPVIAAERAAVLLADPWSHALISALARRAGERVEVVAHGVALAAAPDRHSDELAREAVRALEVRR